MKKETEPPVNLPGQKGRLYNEMCLKDDKAFDWFCHICTQPLTGKYPIGNTELPDDYPECQKCWE